MCPMVLILTWLHELWGSLVMWPWVLEGGCFGLGLRKSGPSQD